LRQAAGHSANRGPQISFDRPELSPCLARFREQTDPAYEEALTLIRAGAALLAKSPEADSPGFQPNPVDQWREAKYLARQQREEQSRQALRAGQKQFETAVP
jgi:hypothetical protein